MANLWLTCHSWLAVTESSERFTITALGESAKKHVRAKGASSVPKPVWFPCESPLAVVLWHCYALCISAFRYTAFVTEIFQNLSGFQITVFTLFSLLCISGFELKQFLWESSLSTRLLSTYYIIRFILTEKLTCV